MKPLTLKYRCMEHYLGDRKKQPPYICWRKKGHLGKHRTEDGFKWNQIFSDEEIRRTKLWQKG